MTLEQLECIFKAFKQDYQELFDDFVDAFWTQFSRQGGDNL